jgi:histidinol-phosphatase (PHP family)
MLLVGVESEFTEPSDADRVEELIRRHKLDFFVGSVHHLLHLPIDLNTSIIENIEKLVAPEAK